MKLRPTKSLIGYAVVLVLSLAPALLINHPTGYIPVLVVLLFGILSFAQMMIVKRRFKIEVFGANGTRYRGDEGNFGVRIENNSILPVPNVFLRFYIRSKNGKDYHSYPMRMTMSPREKRSFDLEADFSHIGVFETGIDSLRIYDLLGLWRLDCDLGEPGQVSVLPRRYYIDEISISDTAVNESIRTITASAVSGYDYSGVREYVFGDPMKMIQWKLSAHERTLMTKIMESYTNVGVATVMDLRIPEYDEETCLSMLDGIVECSCALGNYCVRRGLDFELYFYGSGQKRREMPYDPEDFAPFLGEIYPADGTQECNPVHILREECAGVHGLMNVVYCSSRLDDEIVSALIYLKQCGKKPFVIFLMPEGLSDKEKNEMLIPMHAISAADIEAIIVPSAEGLVRE